MTRARRRSATRRRSSRWCRVARLCTHWTPTNPTADIPIGIPLPNIASDAAGRVEEPAGGRAAAGQQRQPDQRGHHRCRRVAAVGRGAEQVGPGVDRWPERGAVHRVPVGRDREHDGSSGVADRGVEPAEPAYGAGYGLAGAAGRPGLRAEWRGGVRVERGGRAGDAAGYAWHAEDAGLDERGLRRGAVVLGGYCAVAGRGGAGRGIAGRRAGSATGGGHLPTA